MMASCAESQRVGSLIRSILADYSGWSKKFKENLKINGKIRNEKREVLIDDEPFCGGRNGQKGSAMKGRSILWESASRRKTGQQKLN
jgi:hypothetical protein